MTIAAKGWGPRSSTIASFSELESSFKGSPATVDSFVSGSYSHVESRIEAVVITPPGMEAGIVPCNIRTKDGTNSSRFLFEYFRPPPILSVVPRKATLAGKTASADGLCVSVTVEDFPQITSAGDVAVWFGDTYCDGTLCYITSIASASNMLQFSVRVPPSDTAGDVPLTVRYVGSDEYRRSSSKRETKEAVTAFTYYVPLPVVQSAKWCKVCTGNRMCIMNGRCGGGSAPSQTKCPTSGGGILTVVTDNMPIINFNQTTGSVKRTDAVVSLSLGTAGYGTFKRVAYANDARTAYEFRMPPAMSAGNILARVSVHPT